MRDIANILALRFDVFIAHPPIDIRIKIVIQLSNNIPYSNISKFTD